MHVYESKIISWKDRSSVGTVDDNSRNKNHDYVYFVLRLRLPRSELRESHTVI